MVHRDSIICSIRPARRGYTLSEVLLVLAVLATVAALAQPALRNALGDSRLRSAARQVRTELAKTRLRAMQSGTPQQFRYQLENSRFQIAPIASDTRDQDSASGLRLAAHEQAEPATLDAGVNRAAPPRPGESVVSLELPEGVSFMPVEEHLTAAVDEEGWSAPIVFYPNGRTTDAVIRLVGERNGVVEVSLRGLTGAATAGKTRHEKALR